MGFRLISTLLVASAIAGRSPAAEGFLHTSLAVGPAAQSLLPRSTTGREDTAVYDGALAALWLMALDRREEAGRVLAGLLAVQGEDGALPFSFRLPEPDTSQPYVRSGAIAWVGYAAARYLGDGSGGPARPGIAILAHRAAAYLLAHRLHAPGDDRDGLVLGGSGNYRYAVDAKGAVREDYVPGDVSWAGTEHNIDTWFFFEALAHATGEKPYALEADSLAAAIRSKLWNDKAGQFYQGIGLDGADPTSALDCASWGGLFLLAVGDRPRAEQAYQTAERLYAVRDPRRNAAGHRPYAGRPVIEDRALADYFKRQIGVNDWDRFPAIWPEGSAGVALLAWRLGHTARAQSILDNLDRLRAANGGLPGLTRDVPLEFTTAPAFGGTAWTALVRGEAAGLRGWPAVWGEQPMKGS